MELRQLQLFLAVAEERSFTRAARREHVVQSAVSASVRRLEQELGVKLFARTTRSVQLSDAGVALFASAPGVLQAARDAAADVADTVAGVRGSVRLGIMHAVLPRFFTTALADFHRLHPAVVLQPLTRPDGTRGLLHGVAEGDLDLALVGCAPPGVPGVELQQLEQEEMVLLIPAGHELAGSGVVSLDAIADLGFIDVPTGWGSRTIVDELFDAHGLDRHLLVEVGDIATVVGLVRAGLGAAIIAPSSAPPLEDLAPLRLRPAPRFTLSLAAPAVRRMRTAASLLHAEVLTAAAGAGNA